MSVYNPQFTQLVDHNGAPYAGGKKSFYIAGTSEPADTYTTDAQSVKHPNPVLADSRGIWPPIFLSTGSFKCITTDVNDVVIFTEDNLAYADSESDLQSQIDALDARIDALELNQATTGDTIFTTRGTAPTGWVLVEGGTDGGSIGNALSGGTTRANSDCEDLFALIWNGISNTSCPVFTSAGTETTRGANATEDWEANRRIRLPYTPGRAIAGAGQGYLLTNRELGAIWGNETVQLSTAEMPVHAHGMSGNHGLGGLDVNDIDTVGGSLTDTTWGMGTTRNAGSGLAHTNMQPSIALNVMMKL